MQAVLRNPRGCGKVGFAFALAGSEALAGERKTIGQCSSEPFVTHAAGHSGSGAKSALKMGRPNSADQRSQWLRGSTSAAGPGDEDTMVLSHHGPEGVQATSRREDLIWEWGVGVCRLYRKKYLSWSSLSNSIFSIKAKTRMVLMVKDCPTDSFWRDMDPADAVSVTSAFVSLGESVTQSAPSVRSCLHVGFV